MFNILLIKLSLYKNSIDYNNFKIILNINFNYIKRKSY